MNSSFAHFCLMISFVLLPSNAYHNTFARMHDITKICFNLAVVRSTQLEIWRLTNGVGNQTRLSSAAWTLISRLELLVHIGHKQCCFWIFLLSNLFLKTSRVYCSKRRDNTDSFQSHYSSKELHSPEDEQSILFETSRPNRLFSEPTLTL